MNGGYLSRTKLHDGYVKLYEAAFRALLDICADENGVRRLLSAQMGPVPGRHFQQDSNNNTRPGYSFLHHPDNRNPVQLQLLFKHIVSAHQFFRANPEGVVSPMIG